MEQGQPAVTTSDHDRVRVITFDRPDKLNAFNGAQYRALRDALGTAADDAHIGCVVLTGRGRAFSAGSDLDDAQPADDPSDDPYRTCIEQVEAFPKPLVAAVNGLAVGIGVTMLGHADLVFAADSARFRLPFTPLALVPEAGSTVTLPALLGRQAAAHALFTADWLPAAEAQRRGLVWRVLPDDELMPEALDVARRIAAMPLESLVATKRLLLDARLEPARRAREREDAEFTRLLAEPAHRAAVAEFQRQAERKKR